MIGRDLTCQCTPNHGSCLHQIRAVICHVERDEKLCAEPLNEQARHS